MFLQITVLKIIEPIYGGKLSFWTSLVNFPSDKRSTFPILISIIMNIYFLHFFATSFKPSLNLQMPSITSKTSALNPCKSLHMVETSADLDFDARCRWLLSRVTITCKGKLDDNQVGLWWKIQDPVTKDFRHFLDRKSVV